MEDAKKHLETEQAVREAASKEAVENQAVAGNGTDIGHASIKASQEIARASIEASALVFGIGMCCTMVWEGLFPPIHSIFTLQKNSVKRWRRKS